MTTRKAQRTKAAAGTASRATGKPRRKKATAPQLALVADAVNDQLVRDRQAEKKPKTKKQPATRKGKKGLVLYVEPEVTVALRRLALDTGKSVQVLGMEALNGLFRAHELPEFPTALKETG